MTKHRGENQPSVEWGVKTGYYGHLAASYDEHRFRGLLGRLKNWRDQRSVWRAVRLAGDIHRVLDIPCGTGRFLRGLASHTPYLVGADVSRDMIDLSSKYQRVKRQPVNLLEYVQCDAKHLPFRNNSFDLVVSGRFLHHLPPVDRFQVLREFSRVSRKWVLGDFNVQYGLKYRLNQLRSFIKGKELKSRRMTSVKVFKEFNEAGLQVERVYPISWIASEKWYILCRK
jgi:ubiquinone/menaquinone biosynthesis C-methylase UbiE